MPALSDMIYEDLNKSKIGRKYSFFTEQELLTTEKVGILLKTPGDKEIKLLPISIFSTVKTVKCSLSQGGTYIKPDGTLVSGATQDLTFTDYVHQSLEHQNNDGTILTVNSVTGSVDGLLTVTDDYTVSESGGEYGITLVSGTNITTLEQTFTVNYDYTPAGDSESAVNSNLNVSTSSEVEIYIDPTASVAGSSIFSIGVIAGVEKKLRDDRDDIILQPNQWYYFEVENETNTTTSALINIVWEEGED